MIIDFHRHFDKQNLLGDYVEACRELKIDKVCLSTCGPYFNQTDNNGVTAAMSRYPGMVIGFAHIRLGIDGPEKVDQLQRQGFKGIKAIIPQSNYDDKQFYPIYKRAMEYRMPILFHTGMLMVKNFDQDRTYDVSSARMRPVYLEAIARSFPELIIVAAHLGYPWVEEAYLLASFFPNVYLDLTSNIVAKRPFSFFRKLFSDKDGIDKNIFEKIVFGSDLTPPGQACSFYQDLMDELEIAADTQRMVFGDTASRILRLDREKLRNY